MVLSFLVNSRIRYTILEESSGFGADLRLAHLLGSRRPPISLTSLSFHLQAPFAQSVHYKFRKLYNTELSQLSGSLHLTNIPRNEFWNPRKCFRIMVTPTVGV